MSALYLFVNESGNLDFSPTGTEVVAVPELMLVGRRITFSVNKDMPEKERKEIIKEVQFQ